MKLRWFEKMSRAREEFNFLMIELDDVKSLLSGNCSNPDCEKFIGADLFTERESHRKDFKPFLKHNSCTPVLTRKELKNQKAIIMRLSALRKFRKFRYFPCKVCERGIDDLGYKYTHVTFRQPYKNTKGKTVFRYDFVRVHEKCKNKVLIPKGWKRTDDWYGVKINK